MQLDIFIGIYHNINHISKLDEQLLTSIDEIRDFARD